MKTKIVTLGVAAVTSMLGGAPLAAQEITPMRAFMRQKLTYSQNIIEGISLERQDMVLTNATKLMYMTKSNVWMELKVDGYLEQTRKFQDDVIVLGNEARARSNPGMLKAYAKLTGGCIECHQAYRSAQTTNLLAARTNLQEAVKTSTSSGSDPANPRR